MTQPALVLEPSPSEKKTPSLPCSHVPNPDVSIAVPTLIKKFTATFFTAGHATKEAGR